VNSGKQPEELIRLIKKLVGDWKGEISVKIPDGSILKGSGTLKANEVVSGFGIQTEMKFDIEGFGKYEEADLWGYQRWEKKLHIYSITTSAAVHDHVGSWKDENTLEFSWEGLNEGKPSSEKVNLKWVSETEIQVHEVDYAEDKVAMELDYVFRKSAR
jgi:hypothetical protein